MHLQTFLLALLRRPRLEAALEDEEPVLGLAGELQGIRQRLFELGRDVPPKNSMRVRRLVIGDLVGMSRISTSTLLPPPGPVRKYYKLNYFRGVREAGDT